MGPIEHCPTYIENPTQAEWDLAQFLCDGCGAVGDSWVFSQPPFTRATCPNCGGHDTFPVVEYDDGDDDDLYDEPTDDELRAIEAALERDAERERQHQRRVSKAENCDDDLD